MKLKQLVPLTVAGAVAVVLFAGCPKPPSVPETPWGPARGMRSLALTCSTRTIDPAGGQVAYQFDWGDGTQSEWSALFASGTAWGDTHAYQIAGLYQVTAQAKTTKSGGSGWSDPFSIRIDVGEGEVRRRFSFTDPEDPEDSADFSLGTFAIGADGRSYVGCEWAMVFRDEEGRRDKEFFTEDLDGFIGAPTLTNSGVLYACCENETLYALNTDGTRKWTWETGDEVYATPALGTDGTIFIHTSTDSLYAINPDGTFKWAHHSSGNSSPVIGSDGNVYVCSQEGKVYKLDPATGEQKGLHVISGQAIEASPAIDVGRNALYIGDEEGLFVSIDLNAFTTRNWELAAIGETPSSAVIGTDGTVYVGAGGKLLALDPDNNGATKWTFSPPLNGIVSTPAVSEAGYVYFLVSTGKKDAVGGDSLYAVNPDSSYRWATGLDFGNWDGFSSAPKIDPDGYIYVGSGYLAWVIGGIGGPAPSPWPVFQHDNRNTGRAGN